ncbi:AP-4 complex subunit beta-1-like [Ptychodera flava]|uniref:AP-4 complex subunit beta-1-like n=1 Tax=Ptychodera flava TaxID=63121 RepID=UPI00396A07D2
MSYFSSGSISDINDLRSQLRNPAIQADPIQCQQTVRRIVALMTQGIDMSELFTDMVKCSATQDMVRKKLIYLYMSTYAEKKPDLALLAVNTLRKDCTDSNPMVRGLALRTMCSLRLPNLVEYTDQPLLDGLHDKSAYVRRTAVIGCAKIWHIAPNIVTEHSIVDQLYTMLRDKDPIVVTNCLTVLDEILHRDGGVVINQNIAHYLLNRLYDFSDLGQARILQLLLKYKVESEEETFDIMNVIDACLKHTNGGVSGSAMALLLQLTQDLPNILPDVCKRIKGPLLQLLSSGNSELCYTALQHVQLLISRVPNLFNSNYKKFFCRYNDVSYVKHKKIELLTQVCCEDNVKDIVNELSAYCTDVSESIARKSIEALGEIVKSKVNCSALCMERLIGLLDLQLDYVTSQVLVTVQSLLLLDRNQTFINAVVSQLPNCATLVQDSKGKAAMVWLLGHYGQLLPDSPYLLEDMIDNIEEESSTSVKLHLTTATTKLFFSRPAECQDMLGKLLEYCIEVDSDIAVKERATMYYRLLSQDVQKAKEIVCSSQSAVQEFEDTSEDISDVMKSFNSLAIMFGPRRWSNIQLRDKERSKSEIYNNNEIQRVKATQLPQESTTGNLVSIGDDNDDDMDSAKDGDTGTAKTIELRDDATISPECFEEKWTKLNKRLAMSPSLWFLA